MATGNAGMRSPAEQGYKDGKEGLMYDNPYDQRGEELERDAYKKGFFAAYNRYYVVISGTQNERTN